MNAAIKWNELEYREFPEGKTDCLRCQVGRVVHEQRRLSKYKKPMLPLFHLLGFGKTMEEAEKMAERRLLNGPIK